jgi:hypothetical protein
MPLHPLLRAFQVVRATITSLSTELFDVIESQNNHRKAETMEDKKQTFKIKDDLAVTEIYANKIVSTMFDGHAVVVTFGSGRILPERTDEQPKEGATICVNCRIALSPPAAIEFANSINSMMKAIQDAQAQRPAA